LLKSLARSLILHEAILTTESKAKELRPYVEKIVSNGKKETIASRRLISAKIGASATQKLFSDLVPKYKNRKGGYLRVLRVGTKLSDGSVRSRIEFV